jgi:hypothetical protein
MALKQNSSAFLLTRPSAVKENQLTATFHTHILVAAIKTTVTVMAVVMILDIGATVTVMAVAVILNLGALVDLDQQKILNVIMNGHVFATAKIWIVMDIQSVNGKKFKFTNRETSR